MKTASFLVAIAITWSMLTGVVFAGDHRWDGGKHSAKLYGIIETMPGNGYEGTWVIGGKTVNVYKKTEIKEKHGRAVIGRFVEVKGEQVGEKFAAFSIEVEENGNSESGLTQAKFYGTVEAMPQDGVEGTWRVNGREIVVTRDTRIKEKYGTSAVGAYVEVEGNFFGETFTVYEMEVKDSSLHNSSQAYNSKFSGTIEDMPQGGYEGRWVVAGTQVEVSNTTVIDETDGKAKRGSAARVNGVRAGKTISAFEIKITALP